MRRAIWRWMTAVAISTLLVGAGVSATLAATTSISVGSFAFPATTTVKVGDTVTWSNSSGAGHTVTADDGSFDQTLPSGGTASVTFATAGSFAYHCSIHSSMTGTIVVSSAGGAPATDTVESTTAPSSDPAPAILAILGVLMLASTWLAGRRFALLDR